MIYKIKFLRIKYLPVVYLLSEECLNVEHVDVELVEYLYVDVMLQLVEWFQLEKLLALVLEKLQELFEVLQ